MSRSQPQQQQNKKPMEDYITVAERIERFYEKHPTGRINTTIIEHDAERGFILFRAEVYREPDNAQPDATGHAYEYRDAGYVQKTSYIEVCETSAVGRALALLGFEVKRGIASREEMQKQERMPREPGKVIEYSNAPKAVTGDAWACGDALKKIIMDLEADLDSKGVKSTPLRDALEKNKGTRNPATLNVEDAQGYISYLRQRIENLKQRNSNDPLM